jgi:hypothetical protein
MIDRILSGRRLIPDHVHGVQTAPPVLDAKRYPVTALKTAQAVAMNGRIAHENALARLHFNGTAAACSVKISNNTLVAVIR